MFIIENLLVSSRADDLLDAVHGLLHASVFATLESAIALLLHAVKVDV